MSATPHHSDPLNFMHSLLRAVAGALSPALVYHAGDARQLWLGGADESASAATYSTVIKTGGRFQPRVGLPVMSLQWATYGPDGLALRRSSEIEAALCEPSVSPSGRGLRVPRTMWAIAAKGIADDGAELTGEAAGGGGWLVNTITFSGPSGMVSREEKDGRAKFVFNTTISYLRTFDA